MRILWFNWRDIKHPEAGGAEVLTHEIMRRFARRGDEITLFCASVKGRPAEEEIDGVNIVRDGGKYSVYSRGKSYFKKNRDRYDLVIDEVNPRPFLNPRTLSGKPVLVLFHQLIREEWVFEIPFPISYFCKIYENRWLLPYRDTLTLTVSQSSKKDLENIGYKNVKVIPMGISTKPLEKIAQKENSPTVGFIGRLKRHKLPDHAIKAFLIMRKNLPSSRMWVMGDGYMLDELKKQYGNQIIFLGHVNNQVKYNLLSKAHLIFVPSIREGWGMVVTESNAMGTPVIAYDVNGLRDSVVDGINGLLIKEKNPEALAKNALTVLTNKVLLGDLSEKALNYSRQFNWDKTFDFFSSQADKLF